MANYCKQPSPPYRPRTLPTLDRLEILLEPECLFSVNFGRQRGGTLLHGHDAHQSLWLEVKNAGAQSHSQEATVQAKPEKTCEQATSPHY